MVFKICEGISCSSFFVKEFDVIVYKKHFPCTTLLKFWPCCHCVLACVMLWLDLSVSFRVTSFVIGVDKTLFNTLRPRQNGRHFADGVFKYIFLNENVWIPIKISLKFVPKGRINNIPTLIQIMAWRRPGDKPLSETMIVSLPTRICVTRPQWVKWLLVGLCVIFCTLPF